MTAVLDDLERPAAEAGVDADVRAALGTVIDPELDEPITDLGFVRSVSVAPSGGGGRSVEVHLRLPTSFCAPNFAYLMAADAQDAVAAVPGVQRVVVELDDHHDSDKINAGLAADAGYRGTFGHEAEQDLEELRETFRRKAHTAAMERAVTGVLRADRSLAEGDVLGLTLGDLPAGDPATEALLRRRERIGLPLDAAAPVLVDADGRSPSPAAAALFLRKARSVRISIDGNAHFCRGLLRTRYPGSESDQTVRPDDETTARPLLPLLTTPKGSPS